MLPLLGCFHKWFYEDKCRTSAVSRPTLTFCYFFNKITVIQLLRGFAIKVTLGM